MAYKIRTARSIISSKGQVVIPQDLRDELDLHKGDEVIISLLPDGSLQMKPLKGAIEKIFGALHRLSTKAMTVEDMDDAVMEAVTAADDVTKTTGRRS